MSAHTPGPWVSHLGDPEARCDCETILAEKACVATVLWDRGDEHDWQYPDKATAKANARVISAAPALLEALERILAGHAAEERGEDGGDWFEHWAKARAAVARARGAS